jgi:hypothetical protein
LWAFKFDGIQNYGAWQPRKNRERNRKAAKEQKLGKVKEKEENRKATTARG